MLRTFCPQLVFTPVKLNTLTLELSFHSFIPYLLNATIQYHLVKQDDWISQDLQRSMYMDNVLTRVDTVLEALEYYTSSRNCFQKAGMNLRQWISNSPALNRQAHDDGVYAEPMVKVLGLNWNTNTDTLSLSLTN